jgi:hypothetical protein
MVSNGTSVVQGAAGTTTTLLHGNAAGTPTYSAVSLTSDVSGTLGVGNGGTNSTTALSGTSIMISNGTSIVQGAYGTTTTVLHGNVAGSPSYSAVLLSGDVAGTLGVGNGGTGQTSYTTGDLLYASAASTVSKLSDVAVGSVLVSGGAGVAPSYSTSLTLAGNETISGGSLTFNNGGSNTIFYGTAGSLGPPGTAGERIQLVGTAGTFATTDDAIGVAASNSMWFNVGIGGSFWWDLGSGNLMTLYGAGLGIGTNAPNDKLHVEQGNIRLNAAAGTAGFLNFFKAGTQVGYLANGGADNNLWMQATGATGGINFQTGGSNTRMLINSTGTVGIGMASTDLNSAFLQVKGEQPAGTGTSAMFGSVTPISFITGGAGNMNMGWNAYYDGGWRNYTAGKFTGIQAMDANLGDMVFYTGNAPAGANSAISFSEHLRLTNAGHLGINQASPTRSILDVSGAVGNTIAIFGSGSSGISMVQAWPSIGFNSYFNANWKSLGGGAGANIGVNPSTGDMQFISASNVVQDATQATTVQMQINGAGGVTIVNGGGNVPHGCAYYYCFVGGVTQGACSCPGGTYPISGGGDCLGVAMYGNWPQPTFGSGSRADNTQTGWGIWCASTGMDVWVNCCSI